jgi:hypothetical protein
MMQLLDTKASILDIGELRDLLLVNVGRIAKQLQSFASIDALKDVQDRIRFVNEEMRRKADIKTVD